MSKEYDPHHYGEAHVITKAGPDVNPDFTRALADSGAREADRAGGATREPEGERGDFSLLPLAPLQAVAAHLAKGAVKYAPNAWRAGMSYRRCISSALRHLLQFSAGMTDEDHLSACACNVLFLLQYRADIAAGRLPASLDDRFKPPTSTGG